MNCVQSEDRNDEMLFKYNFDEQDYFRSMVLFAAEFFGLTEWNIKVLFEDNLERRGAECRINNKDKQAQIVLFVRNCLTRKCDVYTSLRWSAWHEVAHILVADYSFLSGFSDEAIKVGEAFANRVANAMTRRSVELKDEITGGAE